MNLSPAQWSQVEILFADAIALPAAQRRRHLEQRARDPAVCAEVEALLTAADTGDDFLAHPVIIVGKDAPVDSLPAGTRLGPWNMGDGRYRIDRELGRGGMGRVFAARDLKLDRDVAIKFLHPGTHSEATLRRFEQEARAAGSLDHPNIVAVHDIGASDSGPYIVSELLHGSTLRARLEGKPLSPRKAIDYAVQLATGLGAAHDKGVIHRDLKPENLFVTGEGRLKILDFGIAKLLDQSASCAAQRVSTEAGAVLGTAGYMSPEQVRGQEADQRADIFAFGAILHEMLAGRPPFQGPSRAETQAAILDGEPADLPERVPLELDGIVRRCLEKRPEDRFQSAKDLALELQALAGRRGSPLLWLSRRRWRALSLAAFALLAIAAIAFSAGRRSAEKPPPSFTPLTFRRGSIFAARFAPDGKSAIYSAAWDGGPPRIFATEAGHRESEPIARLGEARLLAVSRKGELAIRLGGPGVVGTLARVPSAGGAPREIAEQVANADWSPDGETLAVVRELPGSSRLEWPEGKLLYETTGRLGSPRVSPKGDLLAFADYPERGSPVAFIAVVDAAGNRRTLVGSCVSMIVASMNSIAWSPSGDEIWYTCNTGSGYSLLAVTLAGKERLITRFAVMPTLQDISGDGRVLLSFGSFRSAIHAMRAGETSERDLSWGDRSVLTDLSSDGSTALFFDFSWALSGPYPYSASSLVFLRRLDGSAPIRLGEGISAGLSPDGRWAIASKWAPLDTAAGNVQLLPTGVGQPRQIAVEGIAPLRPPPGIALFVPGGERILLSGREPGREETLFLLPIGGGKPRPITPEALELRRPVHPAIAVALSPDGKLLAAIGRERGLALYPLDGGEPRPLKTVQGAAPLAFSADGRSLYLRTGNAPATIHRLNLASGRSEVWKQIMPSDPVGVLNIGRIKIAPEAGAYAYQYARSLSELYLVDGWF